jgi:YgiT-type zinc finger domain-containing protein
VDKCRFCKGKIEIKKADVDFRWGDKLFIIKDVPVEVCSQCGERYYSAEVSKKLDRLVKENSSKNKKPEKTIEVPIFTWQ